MIKKDGHYILTVEDWNQIARHFKVNTRTIRVLASPAIDFTEYKLIDIFTSKHLLSFFDHDGKIRIPSDGNPFAYEIDISQVFNKEGAEPPEGAINAIKKGTRRTFADKVKRVFNKNDKTESSKQ